MGSERTGTIGGVNQRTQVFLTHIASEGAMAHALKEAVEKDFLRTVDVFVSSSVDSISPGDRWLDSITDGLARCHLQLVLLSPVALTHA